MHTVSEGGLELTTLPPADACTFHSNRASSQIYAWGSRDEEAVNPGVLEAIPESLLVNCSSVVD